METRANYVAIGTFVLLVIASALGALYWLYQSAEPGATQTVRIIFPEPVTGLSNGGQVLFNGIRVGEVTALDFPQGGGDNVIALVRVNPRAPIKTDTTAALGFQGLTGVAYISLTGGSQSAPSLFAQEEAGGTVPTPTIIAQTSTFTSVIDSAQSVLGQLRTTLDEVNGIITESRDDVTSIVTNVRTVSEALADASPDVRGLVGDIAGAGRAVAAIVPQVGDLVGRADGLLAAVAPERVTSIVENVDTFTATLPQIASDVEGYVGSIGGQLDEAAGTLGEALRGANSVVAAVDVETVNAIIAGVRQTVEEVTNRAGTIGTAIDDAAAVAADARTFTGPLAGRGEALASTIDNVNAATGDIRSITETVAAQRETISNALRDAGTLVAEARAAVEEATPAIRSASAAIAAVTPERVGAILDSAAAIANGLEGLVPEAQATLAIIANRADTIGATLDNAAQISSDLASVSAVVAQRREEIGRTIESVSAAATQAPELLDALTGGANQVEALLAALDVATVNRAVSDIASVSAALAGQTDALPRIVASVEGTLESAQTLADGLRQQLPAVRGVVASVSDSAASAQAFAARLPGLVDTLEPGVQNVTDVLQAVDAEAVSRLVNNAAALSDTLAAQAEPIEALIANANAAASRVESIASALSLELPQVSQILDAIDQAVVDARTFAQQLPSIGETLQSGVQSGAEALDALDPQALSSLLSDAGSFVAGLADQRENIAALVDGASSAAREVAAIASGLSEELPEVSSMLDRANSAAESVREFAEDLPVIGDWLRPAAQDASEALAAIDAQALRRIVDNAATVSDTLAGEAEAFAQIIAKANTIADGALSVTAEIAARAPAIGTAIDNVSRVAENGVAITASLRPAAQNVADIVEVVTPARVDDLLTQAQLIASGLVQQRANFEAILTNAATLTRDASTVAATLAGRAETIGAAIDDAGRATTRVASAADRLPGLVDTVEPGVQNLSDVLSAVDPEAVSAIVTGARDFSAMLAAERETVAATLRSARVTVTNAERIAEAVAGRTDDVQAILDSVAASAQSAQAFTARLPGLVDQIEPGVQNLSDVLSAVDDEAIAAIVADVRTLSTTLAAEAPKIGPLLDTVGQAADNARVISVRLRGELDTVESALGTVNAALADARAFAARLPALAERIEPGVANLSDALAAVDPEAIGTIIQNVEEVTNTVAAARGEVETIVASVSRSAGNVEEITALAAERAQAIGQAIDGATRFASVLGGQAPRVDEIVTGLSQTLASIRGAVGEIDAERVNAILGNIERASAVVGDRAQAIGAAIDDATNAARSLAEGLGEANGEDGTVREVLEGARRIVTNLEGASRQVSGVIESADRLLAGPVPGFVSNASRAALSVEQVSDAFASRADTIAGGLSRFSNAGLDDLRALLNQGRVTLAAIESAVSSFDRNPSRVIFGGSDGPRYSPQRR